MTQRKPRWKLKLDSENFVIHGREILVLTEGVRGGAKGHFCDEDNRPRAYTEGEGSYYNRPLRSLVTLRSTSSVATTRTVVVGDLASLTSPQVEWEEGGRGEEKTMIVGASLNLVVIIKFDLFNFFIIKLDRPK